ncbi:LacI family DNA-binding transcriptional regulator [Arthrobacter tecti]
MHPRVKRTTMREVAEFAGVSIAAVSYVLSGRARKDNGHSGVGEATTQRILSAAAELNYTPNQAARAIRTGKNNLVVLSLTMLSDPWSLALSRAASEAVGLDGRTVLILPDGDWFEPLQKQQPDAVFIDGADENDVDQIKTLAANGISVVAMSESITPDGFDVVRSPSLSGCMKAMEHLLESHTDIACITTQPRPRKTGPSRYTVYLDAMAEAGLTVPPERVAVTELHPASAYDAALQVLSASTRPTAIYAVTDFVALSAINAAHQLHLRIPEDVAIIGAGNTPDGRIAHPSLSTVGPIDAYGEIAHLLRTRAAEKVRSSDRELNLEWQLIVRDSSR